jgi:hypothetical protein
MGLSEAMLFAAGDVTILLACVSSVACDRGLSSRSSQPPKELALTLWLT